MNAANLTGDLDLGHFKSLITLLSFHLLSVALEHDHVLRTDPKTGSEKGPKRMAPKAGGRACSPVAPKRETNGILQRKERELLLHSCSKSTYGSTQEEFALFSFEAAEE